ncbi:MAG: GDP-mannose 4,6-dehydratase [Planctomycetaceae bacterium]|nr:GDP-mannose 4,6-dehydratase [Planctomycetaceae bacterium]
MSHCLVTGGAGFIGSHLVEALLARGDQVSVVDDESTGNVHNLDAVRDHPRLTYTKGTVADEELVCRMVAEADEVYHLAAAVGVQLIAQSPIHTIETNIYTTELILRQLGRLADAGRRVKFFMASTSEVYGKNPKARWTEEDDQVFGPTTRPRWSYGASKAIDEFLALAYWRERALPVVVARLFNVVGPRQTGAYGMVLPRLIDAALRGGPLIVHDDGRQQRCFAHVSDVVAMILALMACPAAVGNVTNVGSDEPISILDLARRVIAAVDDSLPIQFQTYTEAYGEDFEDCRRRVPDLSKLRRLVGLRAKWSLDDIIRQLVEWRRALNPKA